MKPSNVTILTETNENLRVLFRHRNLSNPTEGNRTKLSIGVCIGLLLLATYNLVALYLHNPSPDFSFHSSIESISLHIFGIIMILMFLSIDGSPESIGLGFMFSFSALASSIPHLFPQFKEAIALIYPLRLLSDVFKLYFSFQLARVAPKHLNPWLYKGGFIAAVYACLLWVFSDKIEAYSHFFEILRNILVNIIAAWICFRVANANFKKVIHWRILALVLAGVGFLQFPLTSFLELVIPHGLKASTDSIMQIYLLLTHFLYVLAVFLNISTIEHRIKAISTAKTEAQMLKISEEQKIHSAIARTTQMLAHDVRRPFNILKIHLDSLANEKNESNKKLILERMTHDIQKSLSEVEVLISDIMDIERPPSSDFANLDLDHLIYLSLEKVFKSSKNRSHYNIDFKFHFRHDKKILGDEQKLVRALSNIIENAAQSIGDKPATITFSSFNDFNSKENRVSLEIHNTGSFIQKSELETIFEAFYTKGKKDGTGLGLAIVKKIITDHKGYISAASNQISGTSFRILIPAASDTPSPSIRIPKHSGGFIGINTVKTENSTVPTNNNSLGTIIIIEDDIIFSEGLSKKLANYHTLVFEKPEDFIHYADKNPIFFKNAHAIITDWFFNGSSHCGSDVADYCHHFDKHVFLFSNTNLSEERLKAFRGVIHKDLSNIGETLAVIESPKPY